MIPLPTPNGRRVSQRSTTVDQTTTAPDVLTDITAIATISQNARNFETDFDQSATGGLRASAANVERVRGLFASIQSNCNHAGSAANASLDSERVRYLIRIAYMFGCLSEIFKGMRRQGWVDRSIASVRVVENAVTRSNRPV